VANLSTPEGSLRLLELLLADGDDVVAHGYLLLKCKTALAGGVYLYLMLIR
jgi:hypothetical protein